MVDYYNDLKEREFQVARGHYGDHRKMEDVVQRRCRSIFGKYNHLKQAEIQGDTKTARPHLKILAKVIKNVTDCGNLSRLKVCLGVCASHCERGREKSIKKTILLCQGKGGDMPMFKMQIR